MKRESKPVAKTKGGNLSVSANVSGADGAAYTITGCSVEEVRAAVAECKKQGAQAAEAGGTPEGNGAPQG